MKYLLSLILILTNALLLSAEEAHQDEHGHEEETEEHSSASFKVDIGLTLNDEAINTLGIKTTQAKEEMFAESYEVSASVFYVGSPAKANAIIPLEVAEKIKDVPQDRVKVLGVKTEVYPALRLVEVLFEIPEELKVGTTVPLKLRGVSRRSVVIPKSALLQNTEGAFVYMLSNGAYKRTPVNAGASNEEYFEVKKGLAAGTEVVNQGVEQLWLTELRFTKGGGHGH